MKSEFLSNVYLAFSRSLKDAVALYYPRLGIMGALGFIAFPLFYFIWDYFGEDYENLPLRLVGSVLCLFLALSHKWPQRLRKYHILYCFITAVFSFPFFFTFMAIKNEFSIVWNSSLVACYTILAGFVNWIALIAIVITGTAAAIAAILVFGDAGEIDILWSYPNIWPVIMFAIVFGIYFSYHTFDLHRTSERILRLQAAHMSHEIKSTVSSIGIGLAGLKSLMERENAEIDPVWLDRVTELQKESLNSEKLFEILLINATTDTISNSDFSKCNIHSAIKKALAYYPYRTEQERRIALVQGSDFEYFGSDTLTQYMLINLLRNAYRAIFKKGTIDGDGRIVISTRADDQYNSCISVKDNGIGISKDKLEKIFTPLYTTTQYGEGQGLGLSFVKKVMKSYGGKVKAISDSNGTEILLLFPSHLPRKLGG